MKRPQAEAPQARVIPKDQGIAEAINRERGGEALGITLPSRTSRHCLLVVDFGLRIYNVSFMFTSVAGGKILVYLLPYVCDPFAAKLIKHDAGRLPNMSTGSVEPNRDFLGAGALEGEGDTSRFMQCTEFADVCRVDRLDQPPCEAASCCELPCFSASETSVSVDCRSMCHLLCEFVYPF